MSYNSELQSNNAELQEILDIINALPEVGNTEGGNANEVLTALLKRTITEFSDTTIEEIGSYAFYYCDVLTSVHLPSVTTMGGYAFGGCTILPKVNFPRLKKIDTNTFRGCQGLQKADFGVVTNIATNAFYNCNELTALIIRTPTIAYISSSATVFNGTPIANGTGYIYVPKALLSDDDSTKDYRRATNWTVWASQLRAIEDYPEICGDSDGGNGGSSGGGGGSSGGGADD